MKCFFCAERTPPDGAGRTGCIRSHSGVRTSQGKLFAFFGRRFVCGGRWAADNFPCAVRPQSQELDRILSFRRRLEAGLGRGRGVSDGLDVVAESGEAVGADCACGCFGSWWSGVEKG